MGVRKCTLNVFYLTYSVYGGGATAEITCLGSGLHHTKTGKE